jgi:DNA polymerase delta subunit 1
MLHVTDFLHYFYIAAPVSFAKDDCDRFQLYLENQIAQYTPAIHSVQMVMRECLYEFQGNQQSPYLKITVTDPKFISRVRKLFEEKNPKGNWKCMWRGGKDGVIQTFDNIQYVLRFMIDTKVGPFSIIRELMTNDIYRWPVCRGSKLQ